MRIIHKVAQKDSLSCDEQGCLNTEFFKNVNFNKFSSPVASPSYQPARKNQHQFSSAEEMAKYLIYNYQPTDLSQSSSFFEQAYFFQ